MTDNSNPDAVDDDMEMLNAIAAAFGQDAVDDLSAIVDQPDVDNASLDDVVDAIDSKLVSDDQAAPQAEDENQVEEDVDRYILVDVGGSKFGIPMCNVLEIQRVPPITVLPNVPDWVHGVVNLRGNILSISDLQSILKMPTSESPRSTRRLIVTQSLIEDIDAGLIVDRVLGIRGVPQSLVQDPTSPVHENIAAYLLGVHAQEDELIGLLDIEKLLVSETFRQFESA